MAITVNYLRQDGVTSWHTVMRLHQPFYESAHTLVDSKQAGPFLHRILTMGYGGNVMVEVDRLQDLLIELDDLDSNLGVLAQLQELRSAIHFAHKQKDAIVFFGDMYPELDKQLRHDRCLPDFTDCKQCGEGHKSPFWDVCIGCGYIRNGATTA